MNNYQPVPTEESTEDIELLGLNQRVTGIAEYDIGDTDLVELERPEDPGVPGSLEGPESLEDLDLEELEGLDWLEDSDVGPAGGNVVSRWLIRQFRDDGTLLGLSPLMLENNRSIGNMRREMTWDAFTSARVGRAVVNFRRKHPKAVSRTKWTVIVVALSFSVYRIYWKVEEIRTLRTLGAAPRADRAVRTDLTELVESRRDSTRVGECQRDQVRIA